MGTQGTSGHGDRKREDSNYDFYCRCDTQAKNNFTHLLPNLSLCNLLDKTRIIQKMGG